MESAAGMASICKVVLSLKNHKIPPNLHFKKLNPEIDLSNSSIEIVNKLKNWEVNKGEKRCAAINGFGFSGIISHLIVEEYMEENQQIEDHTNQSEGYLFVLSAKNEKALEELIQSYRTYLEETEEDLKDISYTVSVGRTHFTHRIAVIAKDNRDLLEKLNKGTYMKGISQSESQKNMDLHESLQNIAQFYVNGGEVDWEKFIPHSGRKVILPTYPFQRKRYWAKSAVWNSVYKPKFVHPLLGCEIKLATGQIAYYGMLNRDTLGYSLPRAGVFEMLVAASKIANNIESVRLTDIKIKGDWRLPLLTQVIVDGGTVKIYVEKEVIASAEIDRSLIDPNEKMNGSMIEKRFKEPKENEFFRKIVVDEDVEGYQYHPILIDECFQKFQIIDCEEFISYKSVGNVGYIICKIKLLDSGKKLANIILLNPSYTVVAKIKGLHFRGKT